MTIAAGFVCSDGLLFASDTMYSGEQITYGKKFWTFRKGDTVIVFGGAGLSPSLKRTRDLIEDTVTESMDRFQIVSAIEGALKYVEDLMSPADNERTWALIGLRMDGNYWLYWNDGGRCSLSVVEENSYCVGAGHSLGMYFARSLFKTNMPLRWGKVVAAHLIKHVKNHESGYCGGDTHLVELPLEGIPRLISDRDEIARLEAHLAEFDDAMSVVLPDGNVSDHTLDERLKQLSDVVRTLRKSQFIALPMIHSTVSFGGRSPHRGEFYFGGSWLNDGTGRTPLPLSASQPPPSVDPEGSPDPEDPKGES